jgi:hypothetical protein
MARPRRKRRQHKLIAFKAYYDNDADILDWWESIEEGERSAVIRDLIREHLELPTARPHGRTINLPELLEVRQDTLWIRDALTDMPAYLERVIHNVAANAQPMVVGQQARASPMAVDGQETALTDGQAQRRTQRMKRATW